MSIDHNFSGAIPSFYEQYLVPLIFEPYALDLAARAQHLQPGRVLEVAAGTGVLTRALASVLASNSSLIATDVNQAMLDHAATISVGHAVSWQRADVFELPFENDSFDLVACQFGVMFFAPQAKAFMEFARVLRPDGTFLFSVWDRIEENEFADTITAALARLLPSDPPRFLARTPHGYHDLKTIRNDLAAAGFSAPPQIATVAARSRAQSPEVPAIAYCEGTPLRNEILRNQSTTLRDAIEVAASAIRDRFGEGAVDGKIQAHVISVRK
jgi:SAM-dependent methyltransferase